ncbi:MAG: 23S rRNA (adenine(2503)-C(2))-methyltransferase RlmN [Alphaproteobacteria bacterium]|nr:23S rRNA (adenine(2503)-C(2))-methyltransferase RlmN [Alphaproteobacteria bacterium]MBV8549562.1 23S rRNA (adenine(2503)-C(2))-methyltransferase RlmN [Alphaproteobacteria bacterium]
MGLHNHSKNFAANLAEIDGKRNLVGMAYDEMTGALVEMGLEKFRTKQVWSWIYHHGATDFAQMSTLAKPARDKLAAHFVVARPTISQDQQSTDGTRKWLLKMPDGQEVECVHIPEEDRGALCVSSQVGCTLTCRFCHTGTQRLVRNLEASEIVMQVMLARDKLGEWPSAKDERMLSNIVMMGMGEPLYNYDNVAKALKIIMHGEGIAISKRKITLSTSGVVPMIRQCGEELGVNLAISLHAVTDELRDQIVPINRKYPIKELLQACRDYPSASNARRITFEYIMLKGVNDSAADAKQLVRLLRGIPAKINLIPFNPWPGSAFECPDWDVIEKFGDIVNEAGYASPIRTPRGRDIMAACGQLKSASLRLSATERAAMDKIIAEKELAQGLEQVATA